MCKQGIFSQQECLYLNINEQTASSYRPHSGLIWMQGTHECIIWHVQTLQVNGGKFCNTSKDNARAQVSYKLPLRHRCVYSHAASTRKKCACQFSLRGLCELDILL